MLARERKRGDFGLDLRQSVFALDEVLAEQLRIAAGALPRLDLLGEHLFARCEAFSRLFQLARKRSDHRLLRRQLTADRFEICGRAEGGRFVLHRGSDHADSALGSKILEVLLELGLAEVDGGRLLGCIRDCFSECRAERRPIGLDHGKIRRIIVA